MVLWSKHSAVKTQASVPTAALTLIGSLLLSVLSYIEHQRAVRPSIIINAFLGFSLLFDTARARTLWLQQYNRNIAITFTISVAVKCLLFLLEATQKSNILRSEYKLSYPPEAVSGIVNRSFFWWLNQLFFSGYSTTLHLGDLFSLDKHLLADHLQRLLDSGWKKGYFNPLYKCHESNNTVLVTNKTNHSLMWMTFKSLKWPLLSPIFPRLCLTAFNFCQPFLLASAINLAAEPINDETNNYGHGLIGGYVIVYLGIAVCSQVSIYLRPS